MKDLKVILAEDHLIVRDGIRLLLERMESIHVVGEATNGTEVLEMLNQGLEADVVLTDISMPEMDGISLIKALKTAYPDIKVVILSMLDQQKYIIEAFSEGALGYLLKNTGLDELVFAIRQASMGQNTSVQNCLLNIWMMSCSARLEYQQYSTRLWSSLPEKLRY
jgi:two-component system response regulator NreC